MPALMLRERLDHFAWQHQSRSFVEYHGGECLVFYGREQGENQTVALGRLTVLGLKLAQEAAEHKLRVGLTLHWEANPSWGRIGGQRFVSGPALTDARTHRLLSEAGHVFFSPEMKNVALPDPDTAATLADIFGYLGINWREEWPTAGKDVASFQEYLVHDYAKRQHRLSSLRVCQADGRLVAGNESTPSARVTIEYRDRRHAAPQQLFIQRLVDAEDVILVGYSNEMTATFLAEALKIREGDGRAFWQSLKIVFPSQRVIEDLIDHRSKDERVRRWHGGKTQVAMFLRAQEAFQSQWDCIEFDGPMPFVGNAFDGPRGASVRVAPLLPGQDMKNSFYMELKVGMFAYEQVLNAFKLMCERGTKLSEWNILANRKGGGYRGLVNRKRLAAKTDVALPVLLIMLHSEVEGARRVLLQERTMFNASDQFGTYSNISGRLTDVDVCVALGKAPPVAFESDDDLLATQNFNQITGLKAGAPLDPAMWKAGAIREIAEELALQIEANRLEEQAEFRLERNTHDLDFRIFSLELDAREWLQIKERRPQSQLTAFGLGDLREAHRDGKRFNRLLQEHFHDLIIPIYKNLQISE
jgi:hypothetical protein